MHECFHLFSSFCSMDNMLFLDRDRGVYGSKVVINTMYGLDERLILMGLRSDGGICLRAYPLLVLIATYYPLPCITDTGGCTPVGFRSLVAVVFTHIVYRRIGTQVLHQLILYAAANFDTRTIQVVINAHLIDVQ